MADIKYYDEPGTLRTDYNVFYTIDSTPLVTFCVSTFKTANTYNTISDITGSLVIQSSAQRSGLEPIRFTKTVMSNGTGSVCNGSATATVSIETGSTVTAIGPGQSTTETWTTVLDTSLTNAGGATIAPASGYISQSNSRRLQYQTIYDNASKPHWLVMGVQNETRSTVLNCGS